MLGFALGGPGSTATALFCRACSRPMTPEERARIWELWFCRGCGYHGHGRDSAFVLLLVCAEHEDCVAAPELGDACYRTRISG